MAKEIFEEAQEVFIDDRYEEAYGLYSKALTADDQTDRLFTSKLFSSRAECALKLKNFSDALTDSSRAIEFDDANIKAYLRKGIALYRLDKREEALVIFDNGLRIDSKLNQIDKETTKKHRCLVSVNNDQLKVWHEKCQNELSSNRTDQIFNLGKNTTTCPSTIQYSFCQSNEIVTVQIPIEGLKKEQIQLETTDNSLRLSTKIPSSGKDYSLEFNFDYPIDSSKTTFYVAQSDIQIYLHKRDSILWKCLNPPSTNS